MPNIVSCTCGAKIKLPEVRANQTLRCPRCKTELVAVGAGRIITTALAEPRTDGATCPVCQTAVAAHEDVIACPACDQVHHRDCWTEVGGCATYGCENSPTSNQSAPASTPLSAWGDTKKCPACGETIKSIALRCRYCGTDFETVDPLTLRDLRGQVVKEERLQSTRVAVITLFVLALLGCPAPIVSIVAPCYVYLKRRTITRAGPTYLVMGYSAIVISLLYLILGILFFLFSR
jgi:hypothetical protein